LVSTQGPHLQDPWPEVASDLVADAVAEDGGGHHDDDHRGQVRVVPAGVHAT
jgi:hypothetical protein